ncbi:hypothetical protein GCM10010349_37080 [Streptomyces flavofungini]|nr:hypothetical protein GCM10010349_37080 [Streptomyces flavofungini]
MRARAQMNVSADAGGTDPPAAWDGRDPPAAADGRDPPVTPDGRKHAARPAFEDEAEGRSTATDAHGNPAGTAKGEAPGDPGASPCTTADAYGVVKPVSCRPHR